MVPIFSGECKDCVYCRSGKTNLCGEFRVNPFKTAMKSDGATRFFAVNEAGAGDQHRRPIYHFLNTSTFAEYTVLDSACVVKIDRRAPLHKMCLLSCGISTGLFLASRFTSFSPIFVEFKLLTNLCPLVFAENKGRASSHFNFS